MHPVTKDEFEALIAPLGPFPPDSAKTPLMLAVSGGADSMALAVLARRWRVHVCALVVDHGLRAESACEADQTCARLEEMGIAAQLLTLAGLPKGSTQEQARHWRFQRLEQACVQAGSSVLLMAHHAADQEETLLMRYERSSGPGGMCGIASRAIRERIVIVRPLLSIRPERLRATLRLAGINWCEDPSNQKRHYRRVQIRQDMTLAQRTEMAARSREACVHQEAVEHAVTEWVARHVTWYPEGWVTIPAEAWEGVTLNMRQCAVVARLIKLVGGKIYPPSPSSVERLCRERVGSLGGVCVKRRSAHGDYNLMRETRGLAEAIEAQNGLRWDGRWRYLGPYSSGHTIAALGAKVPLVRSGREVPACVLQTVPAVWRRGEIIAVPEEVRGIDMRIPRCPLIWESGVPVTGERSFG